MSQTLVPCDLPEHFHEATRTWFSQQFTAPTQAQVQGWATISEGRHTLIAAPTGSGKTLAAFLSAIDELVQEAASGKLDNVTRVVYVSPLKALGNDVERNLAEPLARIGAIAKQQGHDLTITTAVRTGDTPQSERAKMVRRPPHILVTTPEGLYALVTSKGGRSMLAHVRTVIVDEIHALAPNRRGAHLSITLERLQALVEAPIQRIGLSATQKPIDEVARFLIGSKRDDCAIIDKGHERERDLMIETPDSRLKAVMSNEELEEIYDRVAQLAEDHRTTLVFVNSRRQCERVAHNLAQRLGEDQVAAHHGSLSPPLRLHAERRLKAGELRVLVATASLELGIDIGDVDLVIQLGALKRIAMFLQRVGRACHWHGGIPKGRLFPLNRDELLECVALLRCVEQGELDRLEIPDHPLDVLAQQMVAAVVPHDWSVDELFDLMGGAYPYRTLKREDFEQVLEMMATGFPTERGRRGMLINYDRVNGVVSARPGAKMTCLISGGTIPDSSDYKVRLEPQGVVVGAIAEDFAIHQLPGHIIQLGSNTWRILQVKSGEVRVEGAPGETPYMPVWFGETPSRTHELSDEISRLRAEIAAATSAQEAANHLSAYAWLDAADAAQLVSYLRLAADALEAMPTQDTIITERFIDLAGNEQVVVHSPLGVRVNRTWALALRHVLGQRFNVELQAAATDDAILISLPEKVSFPLDETYDLVKAANVDEIVAAATLDVPMFMVRWRWAATRALVIQRQRGGKRVPPHIQRTDAEELMLSAFPSQRPGQMSRREGRQGGQAGRKILEQTRDFAEIPKHPLVQQTLSDCLFEAMDLKAFERLLQRIEMGEVAALTVERSHPSPAAFNVITAKPPAFLDNVPLMERRARNVSHGPSHLSLEADALVHPDAVKRITAEVAPDLRSVDDLANHLSLSGVLTEAEVTHVRPWLAELADAGRAAAFTLENGIMLWAAVDRINEIAAAFSEARKLSDRMTDLAPKVALARILGGRLETSGPVTSGDIVQTLGCSQELVIAALEQLEAEGLVLRGTYDATRPGEITWCDRRVLSRIHRLTRNKLRAEIEPVTLQQFYRFLLRWHGLTDCHQGRDGLVHVLQMFDGLELPASLWETEVLPARIKRYDSQDLDSLCLTGQFQWGRLSPGNSTKQQSLSKTTPVSISNTDNYSNWRALTGRDTELTKLSPTAEQLFNYFKNKGPSFIGQVESSQKMLKSALKSGLMELVASGLLTADSFAGLRVLLSKRAKAKVSRIDPMRDSNSGRWSLLPDPVDLNDAVVREAAVERYAWSVLRRYGVVVYSIIQREGASVKWIELLRVLRRMEARGEIRGGYFVEGAGGEHYALPDALPLLREVRSSEPTGLLASISTADPLNLTGVLTTGKRIPSRTTSRLLLRDAVPVAVADGKKIKLLDDSSDLTSTEISILRRSAAPWALSIYR
ncbi:atp-dependent dna helicase [Leptolyngbya sp. Heron Island J]|uniref:DEAD/DEAH box helicase n=1 Tax=Leptolyngbya sp. Heron Island J TaxID=1385935 RepID=UPI0003B9DE87|nr:DEAD/DEAH box helicase [Leptolyngbya sp. Heron Island J]ESA31967.1 atp-dependent dna helicase [Leptolyngbya sp. Heron Island J]